MLELPRAPLVERTQAHIRMIHGDEMADALGLPRHPIQIAEALQVPSVKQRFAFLQHR